MMQEVNNLWKSNIGLNQTDYMMQSFTYNIADIFNDF